MLQDCNLRVRENNRDVLSLRSGDRSIDIIRERGGHHRGGVDVALDSIDRGNDVIQGV